MKRAKAILIIGGSGYVGTHLALRLREQHKVYITYNRNYVRIPGVSSLPLDAMSRDWVKKIVFAVEPDVVIFCASYAGLARSEANPRDAERFHATAPVNVLNAVEILQPKVVFLSSSYVFEGTKGNYHEDDNALPATVLGKNKIRTENFIKSKALNYVIVRAPPLLGRGNGKAVSFLDRLRMNLERGKTIDLPNQEYQSFATIYGFTDLIERVVESGVKNKTLHYGGLTRATHYDLATQFCKKFGYDPRFIRGIRFTQKMKGKQPDEFDFSLNCSQAAQMFKMKPLELLESLHEVEQKLVNVSE